MSERPMTDNQAGILAAACKEPGVALNGRGIKAALKGLEARGLITFRLSWTTSGYRVWPTEQAGPGEGGER